MYSRIPICLQGNTSEAENEDEDDCHGPKNGNVREESRAEQRTRVFQKPQEEPADGNLREADSDAVLHHGRKLPPKLVNQLGLF